MANDIAQRVDRQSQLRDFLESPGTLAKLKATLPRYMSAERLIKISLVATTRNPDLLECSPASILAALIDCTRWGLEPDGIDAALVPRSSKHGGKHVQLEPMYRGLIRLARRSGQVRNVRARCVYAGERFRYRETLREQVLDYRPDFTIERTPATLVRVFAVAELAEGEPQVEIMTKADVDRIRAKSRAQGGPWASDYEEMARKTVIKRLMKFCPRSPELDAALSTLDTEEVDAEVIATAPLEPAPSSAERPAAPRHAKRKNNTPARVLDAPAEPSAAEELDQGEPERVPVPAEERGAASAPAEGAGKPSGAPAAETRPASGAASPPSAEAFDAGHLLSALAEIRLPGDVVGMLAKKASGEAIGSVIGPQVTTVLLRHPDVDQDRAKLAAVIERATGKKGDGVVRDLTPAELYRVVLALYPRKGA